MIELVFVISAHRSYYREEAQSIDLENSRTTSSNSHALIEAGGRHLENSIRSETAGLQLKLAVAGLVADGGDLEECSRPPQEVEPYAGDGNPHSGWS